VVAIVKHAEQASSLQKTKKRSPVDLPNPHSSCK
jgi:hypothetical protein